MGMSDVPARPSRAATLAGYCAFCLIGWNLVQIPSLIRSVEPALHATDADFALFFFVGSVVYAIAALGGGLLTERVGRSAVLAGSALALAAGYAGEALAPSWPLLIAAAIPVNWGVGVIDSGVNGLFLDMYRDTRGGSLNLLHGYFSLGGLVAPFVIGRLLSAGVGWRVIILAAAVAALALAAALRAVAMPSGRHAADTSPSPAAADGAKASMVPFAGLAVGIACYVAAEVGVTNWLVKFLAATPVATATSVLSVLWIGIAAGRILSNWLAERIDYVRFAVGCVLLSSATLVGAVLSPWLPLAALLFGLTGIFFGPVYPTIMAIGGNVYPSRLAALSGGLAASAMAGSMIYPPIMGLLAASVGLRAGMLGAALLGLPATVGLLVVRRANGK
jgi:fucose permease